MQSNTPDTLSLRQVLEPENIANPYPFYERLRNDDPVLWDAQNNGWVLTRYSDAVAVLRDPRFSAQRFDLSPDVFPPELVKTIGPAILALTRQMLFLDPPDHTRLRRLTSYAFTPRVVDAMRNQIQQITDQLLDKVQSRGQMDLVSEFSYPLPAIVIAQILGVPPEDRDQFARWTSDFGSLISGNSLELGDLIRALYGVSEFIGYFRQIITSRRTAPQNDLLQAMINAEEQGDRLSEEELLGNCVLILAAGHGTTTHLISNGMLALMRNPDQMQDLREHPEIITTAIPELLRYDSPVQMISRRATTDIELRGKLIKAGDEVYIGLGAANYDPDQFPNPYQLNLRRQDNRHLSFAHGIHFCLGAPLARIEGEIAFTTLLRRLHNIRLIDERPLPRFPNQVFRGLDYLPITFSQ